MVRFFVGKVSSVDETFHTIEFTIEDFTNSSAIPIPAIPLVPSTIVPEEDDEVFVIQPDSNVEIFYYTQMPNPSEDKTYVELRYGSAYVRIQKENDKYSIVSDTSNNSKISLRDNSASVEVGNSCIEILGSGDTPGINISYNKSTTITMTGSDVSINGHLKVLYEEVV